MEFYETIQKPTNLGNCEILILTNAKVFDCAIALQNKVIKCISHLHWVTNDTPVYVDSLRVRN